MILLIINKILMVLFMASILNSLRVGFLFGLTWVKEDEEKFKLTPKGLLYLGLSIAFVLTSIFTGISI